MMLLMRILESLLGGGVMVAALAVWRLCSPSSSRRLRVLGWVVAAAAACGVVGFFWAAALKVSLRTALRGNALVNAASPVLQAAIVSGIIVLAGGWVLSFIRLGIPRFRAGSTSSLKYEAVSLTVCVALLVTSLELPVQDGRLLTPEQRISQLDRSLRALEDGERATPRDTWDPDYVVKMVGRDPQRLFRWVQNNTYWIPYHGVLRGPVGVLMDSQGNSLDRALLLATLLERAGHNVRLAHGVLSRETALSMLPRLTSERAAAFWTPARPTVLPEPDFRGVALQHILGNTISQRVPPTEEIAGRMKAQLDTRVSDQTRRLLRVIGPTSTDDEWARRHETTLAALRDYWWVQRLNGQKWIDVDLFSDESASSAAPISPNETVATKDIAPDLYHKIIVRIIAERWSSSTVREDKILEHLLIPADVIGQPIALQFIPTAWLDPSQSFRQTNDIRSNILAQHAWTATFSIGNKGVASATLLDGLGIGSSLAGRLGPDGSGPFGGFGAALDKSLNNSNSAVSDHQLSAVWIEYEIRVPEEKPRTVRRDVFDLIGPAARAGGNPHLQLDNDKKLTRGFALTTKTDILPLVSQFAPEFVAHLATESLTGNRELLHEIATKEFSPNSDRSQQQLAKVATVSSVLLMLAFTRMEWNSSGGRIFLDRPNLLTRHESLVDTTNGLVLKNAIDIVANEVGVDLTERNGVAARLQQGVRDTNTEALLISAADNTGEAFAQSSDWLSIVPAQQTEIASLPTRADSRIRMIHDLNDGFVVITPKGPEHSAGSFEGWWRVSPTSGDTLGIASSGWGQAATEESTNLRMAIEFSRGFVFEYSLCQSFPLAVNSLKVINEEIFGGWHPSWTGPAAKSVDPIDMADQNMRMCVVQAIASGFLATLPIVLMTWKVSWPGRSMAFVKRMLWEEEELEVEIQQLSKRGPCFSMMSPASNFHLATLWPSALAAMLIQGPCDIDDFYRQLNRDTLMDMPQPKPPAPRIGSIKKLIAEVRQAKVELDAANQEMLRDTQELARYSGQPGPKDDQVFEALYNRAMLTYDQVYSPAVRRFRDLTNVLAEIPIG